MTEICSSCGVAVSNIAKHKRRGQLGRCIAQHIRKDDKPERGQRQYSRTDDNKRNYESKRGKKQNERL
jgi:hypothetical protein